MSRKFRGFDWRGEERPYSIEDLFSDDPPLKLPIIKGLDKYIPEEEFFDEALFKRMDSAREKDKDDVNKAERNLPKSTKLIKAKRDSVKQLNLPKPLVKEKKKSN